MTHDVGEKNSANIMKKQEVVASLKSQLSEASSVVVAENSALKVEQFESLRKAAHEHGGIKVGVYRNTLARLAIKDTNFACIDESLKGQTVLLISQGEIGALAKLTNEFIKKNKGKIGFKALAEAEECVLHTGAASLDQFARLPTREEALTKLVIVMKAPVTAFVRTTREPIAKLTRALAAIAEKDSE